MAEVLKELPTDSRYRSMFDKFADGQVWKIQIGVDVTSRNSDCLYTAAGNFARKRGMKVSIRKMSDTYYAIQFLKSESK